MSRWAQYKIRGSSRKSGWTTGLRGDRWQSDPSLKRDVSNYLGVGEAWVRSGLCGPGKCGTITTVENATMHLGMSNEVVHLRFKRRDDALLFKLMSGGE